MWLFSQIVSIKVDIDDNIKRIPKLVVTSIEPIEGLMIIIIPKIIEMTEQINIKIQPSTLADAK